MPKYRTIRSTIVPGDGRGRQLGFPTANLKSTPTLLTPAPGIYAGYAQLGQSEPYLPAAIHVGPRPTFNDDTPTIEAHLLDFPDQDLYNQPIILHFVQKIRDVEHFTSPAELSEAVAKDCQQAQDILATMPPPDDQS